MNQSLPAELSGIRKSAIDIIQVNLGNRCNQTCSHCHIEASPSGNRNMSKATAKTVLDKLVALDVNDVEFTGGAPELNSNLPVFIEKLSEHGHSLTVRTNLTVLDSHKYASYFSLYKDHKVKLVASLPSVFQDTTDRQRGNGTFKTSIKVLKKLNEMGYGMDGLKLDLVYNPSSDFLPPPQAQLLGEYKQILDRDYGVRFNDLITIVNVPIKRFRNSLQQEDKLAGYMEFLEGQYNCETVDKLMCRYLISVDYEGHVFDCDFNLALGKRIKGYENVCFWEIDFNHFSPEITVGPHCYACTANVGSSCHGALVSEEKQTDFDVKESVKHYYGEELQQTSDLKTTACCVIDEMPSRIRDVLPLIEDEVRMKFYGCGSPVPLCIEGLKVLDVGCGTGRDCYVMSKLVGEKGFVSGIDMTEKQVGVAQKYVMGHTKRFGFKKPNVRFIHDNIENIDVHFDEESIDLVTSNCVINLTEDKERVLKQIYRILRFGGEFYFSDVYADRRAPDSIRKNPVLYGECLGGALYVGDFERIARRVGFCDPRIVSQRRIDITNPEIEALVGNLEFYSITYRLWKLADIEDACEDYGHVAVYRRAIDDSSSMFELDGTHVFHLNKPERICGNTALMLSKTRFNEYFEILGSFDKHFGLFDSAPSDHPKDGPPPAQSSCCC